jgi:hypothetical protein
MNSRQGLKVEDILDFGFWIGRREWTEWTKKLWTEVDKMKIFWILNFEFWIGREKKSAVLSDEISLRRC